jgi:tRNA1Val (adenine37-N6)-methyltransferase
MGEIDSLITLDSILDGALRLAQPRAGYRFAIDSILLARFVSERPAASVLDLGAGCGVIGLVVAAAQQSCSLVAVEIQRLLADLVAYNARLNGIEGTNVIHADLRNQTIPGLTVESFDLVVANPPYRRKASGRESPNPSRHAARAESAATLADFVAAAERYARRHARVGFTFEASRAAELVFELRRHRLEPKRMRFVHPNALSAASIVLVEARKGGGIGVKVEPPLIVHHEQGVYSPEAAELLSTFARGGLCQRHVTRKPPPLVGSHC